MLSLSLNLHISGISKLELNPTLGAENVQAAELLSGMVVGADGAATVPTTMLDVD
jgi:hypothetical protein